MAVKSAERVLKIFELLEENSHGLTNKEISESLGFAPSSTLGLLQTMSENGYLLADEQKRYSLGGRLLSLGAVAASRFDVSRMATPYMKELMKSLDETCFLGVLSGDEIIYIAKENCERTMATNANIGSRKPVYCTGLGKAFLAFLDKEERELILQRIDLRPYTKHTVDSFDKLREEIEGFKSLGYAVDDQEIEEGLWCIAAPIYNGYGKMIAAISISGLRERMLAKKDRLVEELLRVSPKLSQDLGYY